MGPTCENTYDSSRIEQYVDLGSQVVLNRWGAERKMKKSIILRTCDPRSIAEQIMLVTCDSGNAGTPPVLLTWDPGNTGYDPFRNLEILGHHTSW